MADDIATRVAYEMALETPSSHKQFVIKILYQMGGAATAGELHHAVKAAGGLLDVKEIVKVLWNLQKTQDVTFSERHKQLSKIRLTAQGRQKALEYTGPIRATKEKRGRAPIGTDYTDPQNHGPKAQGGPIERVISRVITKPKIVKAPAYPPPPAPEPPRQNEKPFIDERKQVTVASGSTQKYSASIGKDVQMDTHTEYHPDTKTSFYGNPLTMQAVVPFLKSLSDMGGEAWTKHVRVEGIQDERVRQLAEGARIWGWVERVNPDKRYSPIRLTDSGRAALDKALTMPVTTKFSNTRTKFPEPMKVVHRDEHDAEKKSEYDKFWEEQRPQDRQTSAGDTTTTEKIFTAVKEAHAELRPNLDDFPLIKDLMGKETRLARYERAAEILAEDPDDQNTADLVLSLLEKVQITPLEREVIRYVRSVSS